MAHHEEVSPNIRIADILEQLEELNKMIAFHKNNSPDDSMLKQYQYMQKQFMEELTVLLKKYNVQISQTRQIAGKTDKTKIGVNPKKMATPASQSSSKS